MRPPGSQKISFGDFNSPIKAARAVDAAFHHYGKPDLINFADTSRILSEQPKSAGLDWKEKLKLVKKQANLLASIAGAHDLENIAGIDSSAGIIDSKRISAQKILKKSLTDLRQKKQSNLHQESLYEDPVVLSEQPKLVGLDHWKLEVHVRMCCSNCVYKVEDVANTTPGISQFNTDRWRSLLTITETPNGILDRKRMVKRLKKATNDKKVRILTEAEKQTAASSSSPFITNPGTSIRNCGLGSCCNRNLLPSHR